MKRIRLFALVTIVVGAILPAALSAYGDAEYVWPALEKSHRIAVVAPGFWPPAARRKATDDTERRNRQALIELTQAMSASLPRGLASSGRFRIVPPSEVSAALRSLHWTAASLFEPPTTPESEPGIGGLVRPVVRKKPPHETQWPKPIKARIVALARRLKVDAVLVGSMREPATIRAGLELHHEAFNPNPLNVSLKRYRDHVISPRVEAFLITAGGTVAWHDEQAADHPRTKPATPKTLLIDWKEATQEVAQDLSDSLTRLPPPKRTK